MSHVALLNAANLYVETLNKIGDPNCECLTKEVIRLCTKACKKVRNGKVLFEGSEFFAEQLDAGKEWLGAWAIQVQDILPSTYKRSATIRYLLSTEKEADLIVLVILYFDENYLIDEINEVHNQFEN